MKRHRRQIGDRISSPALKPCTLAQVLSVDTALSIQSHPDKELAARLHAERPEVRRFCCRGCEPLCPWLHKGQSPPVAPVRMPAERVKRACRPLDMSNPVA